MPYIAPHQEGYFAAQAEGFRLIREIESLMKIRRAGHGMLCWDSAPDLEEYNYRNARLKEYFDEMHQIAKRAAATNAYHIITAQQRRDQVASIIRYYALMQNA